MDKKILIIDDDDRNIFALKMVLRSRGYTCLTAYGADRGIKMLAEDLTVGIVLMDMMMPDMDGYEAIGKIRSNKDVAHIPVIAVTAQAMIGDKERCLEAGAVDYISKPLDVDLLLELLNKYLK